MQDFKAMTTYHCFFWHLPDLSHSPPPPLPLTSLHLSRFLSLWNGPHEILALLRHSPISLFWHPNIFHTSPFPQQGGIERKQTCPFLAGEPVPTKTMGAVQKQFKLLSSDGLDCVCICQEQWRRSVTIWVKCPTSALSWTSLPPLASSCKWAHGFFQTQNFTHKEGEKICWSIWMFCINCSSMTLLAFCPL